jgi:hypothetical protein
MHATSAACMQPHPVQGSCRFLSPSPFTHPTACCTGPGAPGCAQEPLRGTGAVNLAGTHVCVLSRMLGPTRNHVPTSLLPFSLLLLVRASCRCCCKTLCLSRPPPSSSCCGQRWSLGAVKAWRDRQRAGDCCTSLKPFPPPLPVRRVRHQRRYRGWQRQCSKWRCPSKRRRWMVSCGVLNSSPQWPRLGWDRCAVVSDISHVILPAAPLTRLFL